MTDWRDDAVRDLVQRAHHSDPEPAEFDIQAGLADLLTRSAPRAPGQTQADVGATRPSVQADPTLSPQMAEPASARQYKSVQPSHVSVGIGLRLLDRLRRRRARRRAEELEARRQAFYQELAWHVQASYQELAWHVQDVFVECGLSKVDYSATRGHVPHIPQVVSVVPGPPIGLIIQMLPEQTTQDFAKQAHRIASNLNVAEVRVNQLRPHLIRLDLVQKQASTRIS